MDKPSIKRTRRTIAAVIVYYIRNNTYLLVIPVYSYLSGRLSLEQAELEF